MPQPIAPQAALEQLFIAPQIQSEWFTPEFLQAVPVSQIEQIVKQLKATLGNYQSVRQEGSHYLVLFDGGVVPTRITLDPQGRIAGLLFEAPRPMAMSLEEAIAQLQALPGEVGFLVVKEGTEMAALNADRALAVGSTFKLAVLDVLARQVETGQRQWSDVVALRPHWKSLPTGILQNWPEGSPLTLFSLASLMISISDNTATDALIEIVGRDEIEAIATHNRPFLTTREAFILKNPENAELLQRYRQGDETTRRQILTELQTYDLPGVEMFGAEPLALDVEWFFSTRELCQLMENVAPLPLIQINPGVANPQDWRAIAYKGGSEPGVLNFTTSLEDGNGQTYCISATWNNKQAVLDETRFQTIYSAAITGLKELPSNTPQGF
jgi:beta-lactamase class A